MQVTSSLLEVREYASATVKAQSRVASAVESIVNTTIGFCISWVATLTCMKLLGIQMSFHQLWWYTWFMTAVSVARSYCVRRMWNSEWWLRWRCWRITRLCRLHDKWLPL
jgi:hypothetical protein